jgi:hypothetical protein
MGLKVLCDFVAAWLRVFEKTQPQKNKKTIAAIL